MRGLCAITGTTGYVGSRVARHLANTGWEIRALARPRASQKCLGFTQARFELGDRPAPHVLQGADALVHAAYDFSLTSRSDVERVNVEGSRRLFAAARDAGIDRIVCISTLAAFPGARSRYGQAKLEIERAAIEAGAAVVRPGLVWGPEGAAMFGALQRLVAGLPVVPLFVPGGLELSLVHEDDLAALVARVLELWPRASGALLVAASDRTLTFGELLGSLARRAGGRPRFVRLPWRAAWLGLRALEAAGVTPPFRSDSLVSLVAIDREPFARATDSAERYGVRFRPYTLA
jgi:nucleoside-diphosphate-sugar epimerase